MLKSKVGDRTASLSLSSISLSIYLSISLSLSLLFSSLLFSKFPSFLFSRSGDTEVRGILPLLSAALNEADVAVIHGVC